MRDIKKKCPKKAILKNRGRSGGGSVRTDEQQDNRRDGWKTRKVLRALVYLTKQASVIRFPGEISIVKIVLV